MQARNLLQSPAFTGWTGEVSLGATVNDYTEFLTITSDIGIMCLDICTTHNISNSDNSVKRFFINKGRRNGAVWETCLEFYNYGFTVNTYTLEIYTTGTTARLRVRHLIGSSAMTIKIKVNAMTSWETTTFAASAITGTDASVLSMFTETPINISQFRGFTADRILFGATNGTIEQTAYLAYNDRTLILRDSLQNICVGTSSTGAGITTGTGNLMYGANAGGNITTGYDNTFIGPNAGLNANSSYNVMIGIDAGRGASTGANHVAIGLHALDNASGKTLGSSIVCIGADAGRVVESANYAVIIGAYTGAYLSGQYSVAIAGAGTYSKGANNINIGQRSGEYVARSQNICIGTNAGRYAPNNQDNIFIGANNMASVAGVVSATFKNFDSANVDISLNRITIAGHGLTVGAYYGVQYVKDAGGTVPGGLTNNAAYMISVVDANTIQFEVDISSVGTGATHYLYLFQTWTGLVLIGTSLTATKSNQIIIGSSSSDEFLTYAYFKSLSTKANFMPVGTTAQRPSAAVGQYRWNTTTGKPEFHNGTTWIDFIMSDVYVASTSKWTATGAHIVNNNAGKVGIVSTGVAFTPTEQLHLKDGNFRVETGVVGVGTAPASNIKCWIKETTVGNTALSVGGPDNTSAAFSFYVGENTLLAINSTTGNKNVSIGNSSSSTRVTLNHRTEIISSGNTASDYPLIIQDSGANEVYKMDAIGGVTRTGETRQYFQSAKIFGGAGSTTEMQSRMNAGVIDIDSTSGSHFHIELDYVMAASTQQYMIWLVGVMSATSADTPVVCDIKTAQGLNSSGTAGGVSTVSANANHTVSWYKSSNGKPTLKVTNTSGTVDYTQLTVHILRGGITSVSAQTAPAIAQVVVNTGTNI